MAKKKELSILFIGNSHIYPWILLGTPISSSFFLRPRPSAIKKPVSSLGSFDALIQLGMKLSWI
jgi:hypothetical protein